MQKPLDDSIIHFRLKQESEELASIFYDLSEESFAYGSPWTIDQIEGTLNHPSVFYILAETKGEIAGFLGASLVQTEAEVYTIVVSSQYKRQGIGSGLINELKRMMRANGARELFLEVRTSNKEGILFYKSLGFYPVGVRPNYYSHPEEDAVVLKTTIE